MKITTKLLEKYLQHLSKKQDRTERKLYKYQRLLRQRYQKQAVNNMFYRGGAARTNEMMDAEKEARDVVYQHWEEVLEGVKNE